MWKLLETSIAMVLEQLAVALEILESLLYFITWAIFPMCCVRWILFSSWSFSVMHSTIDSEDWGLTKSNGNIQL